MSEDMLEDITLVDNETQIDLENFQKNVKLYEQKWVDAGKPENGYYGVIKSALWSTFKWDILWSSFLSFISDVFAKDDYKAVFGVSVALMKEFFAKEDIGLFFSIDLS